MNSYKGVLTHATTNTTISMVIVADNAEQAQTKAKERSTEIGITVKEPEMWSFELFQMWPQVATPTKPTI